MLDVDNPQVRIEELMQRVREEVRRRREQKALNAHGASSAGETRIPDDWRAIDEALAVAQKYHAVGLSLPPMTRQQGIKRQLAVPIARLVLRFAQLVARDQRAFNQAAASALGAVYGNLKVQAACATELLRQIQALQEGVDETLTLHRLGLFGELGRSFKQTNALESIMAQVEARVGKLDRWQNSQQKQRWLATALLDIEPRLRRIKGYRALPKSRHALQRMIGKEVTAA